MARLGYIETPYPKQQNSPQSNPYFHSLFYFMVISENWWCLCCLLFHSKFDGRTKCHLLPWNLPHFSFLPMETELSSWEGHSIQPLEPVIHRQCLLLWGQKPASETWSSGWSVRGTDLKASTWGSQEGCSAFGAYPGGSPSWVRCHREMTAPEGHLD